MPMPIEIGGSPSRSSSGIVLAHRRPHGQRGAHRIVALPRVRLDRAEVGDDAVADEASDMSAMLVDGIADALVIAVDHPHEDLRLQPLANSGGSPQDPRASRSPPCARARAHRQVVFHRQFGILHHTGRALGERTRGPEGAQGRRRPPAAAPGGFLLRRHWRYSATARTQMTTNAAPAAKVPRREGPITIAPMRQRPLAREVTPDGLQ